MKRIFCMLFGHKGHSNTVYIPSLWAPVVTRTIFTVTCIRCGKRVVVITDFDPETGQPIEGDDDVKE